MVKQAKKTHLPRRKPRAGVTRSPFPFLQGREKDVALIDHLIDRIDQGGSTLVINGEPGIGKSALLAAAKQSRTSLRCTRRPACRRVCGSAPVFPDCRGPPRG